MTEAPETRNSSITKPASKVMLGGILFMAVSLASNMIIAAIFGANTDMDAFYTALVIPNYLQLIFYSSLSFVLVPAFIEAQTKKEDEDAWALVGTFFLLTLIVLFCLSIVCSLLSAQIIDLLAPGFQKDKAELASQMLSIMLFATPFIGLGTLTVGVQNARKSFFAPSVAPAFGALGNLIVLLAFYKVIGSVALAWGFLASTIIIACFTATPLLLHGWTKTFPLTDKRVVGVLKLMAPLMFYGMLISFTPVAERYFSSGLPDGQIAYMGYANKISGVFVALMAAGIAATIYPTMARAYTEGGVDSLAEKNSFGLRLSTAVAIPSIAIVAAVGIPLISVLFERGAFTHFDTIGVSLILFPVLLESVLFRMTSNIFQRSYIILKMPNIQVIVSIAALIIYILIAGFFVRKWGYIGLVWASVMKRALTGLINWIILSRKFPNNFTRNIIPSFVKYIVVALVVYACGHFIVSVLASVPVFYQLLVGGVASLLLYLFILYILDREILKSILEMSGIYSIFNFYHAGRKSLFPKRF